MDKTICQSCGMPMNENDFGTNVNGTKNKEYCHFCFNNGNFTDDGITMEEKIKKNIEIAKKMGIPEEEAKVLAENTIPKLKRWNPAKKVEYSILALKDRDYFVRRDAASDLKRCGNKEAIYPLIEASRFEKDWLVLKEIIEALAEIGDESALEHLYWCASNLEPISRYDSFDECWEKWDPKEAARNVLWKIKYRVEKIKELKEGTITEESLILLINELKQKNRSYRFNAVMILREGGWQPKDNVERAWYLLGNEEWEKLVKIGDSAVEPLILALKDDDKTVRQKAAWALGKIGDARAIKPLKQARGDTYDIVKATAIEALNEIKLRQEKNK